MLGLMMKGCGTLSAGTGSTGYVSVEVCWAFIVVLACAWLLFASSLK